MHLPPGPENFLGRDKYTRARNAPTSKRRQLTGLKGELDYWSGDSGTPRPGSRRQVLQVTSRSAARCSCRGRTIGAYCWFRPAACFRCTYVGRWCRSVSELLFWDVKSAQCVGSWFGVEKGMRPGPGRLACGSKLIWVYQASVVVR